jgi:RNA polymerase sigma-70 factor (ECF subfamily)
MSLTGAQDSALDVLQEVWIRTFRGIRKLKDPGSLRPWLYSITHGIAVDRIRKNYSREQAEKVQLERIFRKQTSRHSQKTMPQPFTMH